jgi:D-xylose transport system permease protein
VADVSEPLPAQAKISTPSSARGLAALEIDLRLFGMVAALVLIILGFGVVTGGDFLRPINLINLTVQAVSVAIIATGMTLIIVSRNIDLSVGSIVGVVGMFQVLLMTQYIPQAIGYDNPLNWILALLAGLILGGLIGAFQGGIIAYVGVPSFIVTLGGLLAWRGVTFAITQGVTIAPVDPIFRLLGGGPRGSIGGTASWIVGIIVSIAVIALLVYNRRRRRQFGFAVRPMWAEVVLGVVGIGVILGLVYIANSYIWPDGLAQQWAQETGLPIPPGGIQAGIPWPVIVLLGVTLVMTFIATRRKFGRYVFAIGGNPEAAELGGINTRWTIMRTFIVIGILCGLAAAITSARIDGATLDLGAGYELYVIAACVIGGTSFAGGIGTIPGAVLGALVMAALAYGLSFIGLVGPIQDVVAGIVLVTAVGFDTVSRRRSGG